MKASETNFFKFLEGNKQFSIPIYQRTYSWTRGQCAQLWADIVRAATRPEVQAHFVGSIVYIQDGLYRAGETAHMLVIDGQQRLTTLTLLLAALVDAIVRDEKPKTINVTKITDAYLTNLHEENDNRFKLILTQHDKDTLIALLEHREPPATSSLLADNYQFFLDQIRSSPLDAQVIYSGIGKLVLVDIALDRDHDNPQLIFESLNSTGMALSQADLIRNYVLMRLEPRQQTALYKQHWYPMEQMFLSKPLHIGFDAFLRHYLTMKRRAFPRQDEVYKIFKEYHEETNQSLTIDALIAEMHHFARLYERIAFGQEREMSLRDALRDLMEVEVVVAFPFLLELYDDYVAMRLDRNDLLAIIRLVESYVFRRAICEIPTNSMNKTFATLMRGIDKSAYLASVQHAFMGLNSYKRFPRDGEFRGSIETKDVYHFQRRNYLLRKLENMDRKESATVERYTIEHIMPQNPNLSPIWQAELGPNWQQTQQLYLHTLGNLTLTGYNSEMSDKPFQEKRDMPGGFHQSPLTLNAGLSQIEHWNDSMIKRRAAQLADRAVALWSIPADDGKLPPSRTLSHDYSLDYYLEKTPDTAIREIFAAMRQRILNLDPEVYETYFKHGITYRIPEQFAWMQIHGGKKFGVHIEFSSKFDEIDDPDKMLKSEPLRQNPARYLHRCVITAMSQVDAAMHLVRQSMLLRRDRSESDDADEDQEEMERESE